MALPRLGRHRVCLWLFITAILGLAGFARTTLSQDLSRLLGTWSGKGKIVFKADKAESIKCNAYNRGEGSELRPVIRCASPSYKIEIRSKLQKVGNKLSGIWEERTYNATGTATGRITSSTLSVAISGGGFRGEMDVSYTWSRQTVRITTEGFDMKSVDISLLRSG